MSDPPRLLIVEDSEQAAIFLSRMLEAHGYRYQVARDGMEAISAVRENPPDLVLLDIMMPTLNGYQVCRELKDDPETRAIPIVMLTAKSQESDKFWGKEAGADVYVVKPFDMDELLEAVVEQIGGLLDP